MHSKKLLALMTVTVIALAMFLTGCKAAQVATPAPASPAATTAASASTTASLSGKLEIAGSTSVQGLAEDLSKAFMVKYPNVKINVQGGGSSVGVSSASDGTCDIGTVSRALKDEEKKVLKDYTIALDGIAVAVNPKNGVTNLTADQITKIFKGEITNWKDVGGVDKPIIVIIRESSSGTRDGFQSFFKLQTKDAAGKFTEYVTETAIQTNDNGSMMTNIAGKEGGIGYCSLGVANDTIKMLSVDGVVPSEATVLDGTYQYQRLFLLVTKGEAQGLAKTFIEWVMGDEGKAVITKKYVMPKA